MTAREVTLREAEQLLTEYAAMVASRDDRVRTAYVSGLARHRIHVLSGLGRNTVDRILAADGPDRDQRAGSP